MKNPVFTKVYKNFKVWHQKPHLNFLQTLSRFANFLCFSTLPYAILYTDNEP